MADIRYEKILQRQGLRSELPQLDPGEIGFTTDTAQVFIGTDPDDSTYVNANVVVIDPFPNAIQTIQTLLNFSTDYNSYSVTEGLTIETESKAKAAEIVNYINNNHTDAVARLESNIEFLTSENVNDYIHPSDFNVNYLPSIGALRPSRSLLTKQLDSDDGGVFLEFDLGQVYHLRVTYTLVQNDGWHRRSGVMTLMGDNSTSSDGQEYIGFEDDQLLMNAAISGDFIQFDAEVDTLNSKIRVLFYQPTDHTTKIYYRLERWNIAGVVSGEFTDMPTPPPNQVLGINDNDGALGLYGDAVLGVNTSGDYLDGGDVPLPGLS